MDMVLTLAWRNIRIYVRNRMSVFFSFHFAGIRALVDSWIMAGLLSINAVTITLGVLGTMVFDIEYRRFSDFVVSPIRRLSVVVSYLIAAWVIGFLFSLMAFAVGELYIVSGGGSLLSLKDFLAVVGMLALAVVSSSSIMFLLASFLRSGSAFGTLSTLLGTLIGFITGVYVPLGVLPGAVQKFVILVPFSYSAAMLRQVFCAPALAVVFKGAPPEALSQYTRMYGIKLFWGAREISMAIMVAFLLGVTVLFLLLSVVKIQSGKKG